MSELAHYLRVAESILSQLVALKDGPRDDTYYSERDGAWERARGFVGATTELREAAGRVAALEAGLAEKEAQNAILGDSINDYIDKVKAERAEVERLRAKLEQAEQDNQRHGSTFGRIFAALGPQSPNVDMWPAEIEALRSDNLDLRGWLAVMNGDGGQHQDEVGVKHAVEDALARYYGCKAEAERLRASVPNPNDLAALDKARSDAQGENQELLMIWTLRNYVEALDRVVRALLPAPPSTVLNHQDSERVARLLDDPPEPNEALRDLMRPNAGGDEQ